MRQNVYHAAAKKDEFMKNTGIVFDIQRFSIHDGPGIRTTVFLKGCSLRCQWCHNPESWAIKPQLMFNHEKCVHCLACVGSCPNQVHKTEQGKHTVEHRLCGAAGACISKCIYGALKLSGKEMSVEDVLKDVCADRKYYENSGGGMTVSGGEPMLQFEFLQTLLSEAKKQGIHTCVETSGFADREKFEEILKDVDMFLIDVKHINNEEHKKYTGVYNEAILSNIEFLHENGAKILLRLPFIPGVNDTDEHIKGVAALLQRLPNLIGAEILPYHDMGKGKWGQIGKQYELMELKNSDKEQKAKILQRFLDAGCRDIKI